jgi:hypothetical protein
MTLIGCQETNVQLVPFHAHQAFQEHAHFHKFGVLVLKFTKEIIGSKESLSRVNINALSLIHMLNFQS